MKALRPKAAPQFFKSPITLPIRRSGKMEIRHRIYKRGDSLPIVSVREALLRGDAPSSIKLPEDLLVHELYGEGDGCWMTDMPQELQQIAELLVRFQPRGRCLVGGLGLGVLTKTLMGIEAVSKVTTVEINPDVVKLCWHYEDPRAVIVRSDIKDFLEHCGTQDFFFLDTWQAQSEGCWWTEVMPMRRIIRRRFGAKPQVWCWAEDQMWGQIANTLRSFEFWRESMRRLHRATPEDRGWYQKYLPLKMSNRDITHFLTQVGLPAWEERWGALVDRGVEEVREFEEPIKKRLAKMEATS